MQEVWKTRGWGDEGRTLGWTCHLPPPYHNPCYIQYTFLKFFIPAFSFYKITITMYTILKLNGFYSKSDTFPLELFSQKRYKRINTLTRFWKISIKSLSANLIFCNILNYQNILNLKGKTLSWHSSTLSWQSSAFKIIRLFEHLLLLR